MASLKEIEKDISKAKEFIERTVMTDMTAPVIGQMITRLTSLEAKRKDLLREQQVRLYARQEHGKSTHSASC
jgi:hypothetical protein